jgi:hypothetical protein
LSNAYQLILMNNLNDLLPEEYRYDVQIIKETTEQIIRDFQNDQLKIIYSGDQREAFNELKKQLIPFISDLLKNKTAFHALLYRVDISEREYRTALNSAPADLGREELIAELIIRREFKKILTRKYFSKGS